MFAGQVVPRPVLSILPLCVPVLLTDTGVAQLEAGVLQHGIHLAHMLDLQARTLSLNTLWHGYLDLSSIVVKTCT